ncbi:MAG: head maturation protease, ClpP-related [Planctomycetota bacterium]
MMNSVNTVGSMTGAMRLANSGKSSTGGDRVEVYLEGSIGPAWADMIDAATIRAELDKHDAVDEIDLRINSGGGSIIEGLGIYNYFSQHRAKVNVYIDGLAGSTAGWIAMAGDEISIAENAFVMLHDPHSFAGGNAAELRREADTLDRMKDSIAKTFAKRTNIEESEIADMMTAETWLRGGQAVGKGFADKVIEAKGYAVNCDLGGFNRVPDYVRGLIEHRSSDTSADRENSERKADKSEVQQAKPSVDARLDELNAIAMR